MQMRRQRPTREAVRDAVEQALEDEVQTLKHSVNNLELRLDHVETERRRLTSIKKELELDLKHKAKAMKLDRRCLELDLDTLSLRTTPPPSPGSHVPRRPSAASALSSLSLHSVATSVSRSPRRSPRNRRIYHS
mmetsp:Transcript_132360/g.229523  ORF Transcript_132360/g.229523 Transcript_132360/m.229523 type:complete len:134 (-) Transcript_132360:28-429(-)